MSKSNSADSPKVRLCLVGDEMVGKTSLAIRYVDGFFRKKYRTTLGTTTFQKRLEVPVGSSGRVAKIQLLIQDIWGDLEFAELLKDSYFQRAKGILAVCDCTRKETADSLQDWFSIQESLDKRPVCILVNKVDLGTGEAIEDSLTDLASEFDALIVQTSAKTGKNVEKAFWTLARRVAIDEIDSAQSMETEERVPDSAATAT